MKEPEINLNGWVTIANLAKSKPGKPCTPNYISKLIKQGKIDSREFPELNGLRLVPGNYFDNGKA